MSANARRPAASRGAARRAEPSDPVCGTRSAAGAPGGSAGAHRPDGAAEHPAAP
ncbi:hypothetical protein HMPREF9062_0588 [Actinomyces sp. oral taxon 448 str. F0400]|nr:hypothetical protein HMPREF9062_0588 [Actinomyces sp. oral taxon 448 str. F0400]